ncbi:8-oxo-dGTP pyrophosphatase MutT (NUDIX family) [Pullulanibacillus pueri]|uniref:DNA mismatch repair protein MutT n=1 Tax=Pullulanibacillus pueri TaxID=1437324 RepID=A0A8J2ZY41_9BACL|nr:NUDIX hydrolase [Pullulanibacillus pueri]MBM7681002.1 8-oxo-dGTP pyrophosphatase MutT (NUDIX family) [Pullulanibacillus pueri]GGH86266.1 DNA mismatch repair protein MutT [Pullulanibacillus pueri]
MDYITELRKLIGHRPVILPGSVVIILNEKDQVLLQQRKHPYGIWGLPGGLMELGESTEETARREVFEETGLTVGALDLLGVFSGKDYFAVAENGDEFYVLTIAYVSREVSGCLTLHDDESLNLKYFPVEELPPLVKSHQKILASFS